MIVAIKEREEVVGQVPLILRAQCANNAEINGSVFRFVGICHDHENISRMHVGVKKIVAKYLGEENFDAVLSEKLNVSPSLSKRRHVADRYAVDTLLYQHFGSAKIPVNVRDVKHIGAREVSP